MQVGPDASSEGSDGFSFGVVAVETALAMAAGCSTASAGPVLMLTPCQQRPVEFARRQSRDFERELTAGLAEVCIVWATAAHRALGCRNDCYPATMSGQAQFEAMQHLVPIEVAAAQATGTVADYMTDDAGADTAVARWCETYKTVRQHIINLHLPPK